MTIQGVLGKPSIKKKIVPVSVASGVYVGVNEVSVPLNEPRPLGVLHITLAVFVPVPFKVTASPAQIVWRAPAVTTGSSTKVYVTTSLTGSQLVWVPVNVKAIDGLVKSPRANV